MNIIQAHRKTLARLTRHEYSSDAAEARAVARILLDDITSTRHAHLTRGGEVLTPPQQARFETALTELGNGRPLAYILGKISFYNLEFRCDQRALIPRPETELLVEFALEELKTQNSKLKTQNSKSRLADLGTGTGCISIAIAKNNSGAQIFATDVSPDALSLARENASTHDVQKRIEFLPGVLGDWAAPLLEYSSTFDLIISNPPYIAPRDIEKLQTQVRDFEPRRALDGGEDGLDCYRQIAAQCKVLLKPTGVLACELGAQQFEDARTIFESQNWRVEKPIFDFVGIARVLVARPLP